MQIADQLLFKFKLNSKFNLAEYSDWAYAYLDKNSTDNFTFIDDDEIMGIIWYFSRINNYFYFVTADRNLAIQYLLNFGNGNSIDYKTY